MGVNFYQYLKDHLSETREIPSLVALNRECAKQFDLGAS